MLLLTRVFSCYLLQRRDKRKPEPFDNRFALRSLSNVTENEGERKNKRALGNECKCLIPLCNPDSENYSGARVAPLKREVNEQKSLAAVLST